MKWSSVWSKVKIGLGIAGAFFPPVALIAAAVDSAENIAGADGPTKRAKVEAIAELAIDYSTMSDEHKATAKAFVQETIEDELAVREAVAKLDETRKKLQAFVESVKGD